MAKIALSVAWVMSGQIKVEADSTQDAINKFRADDVNLPENGEYVPDSLVLSADNAEDMQMITGSPI